MKTADAISEILKREGVEWVIGFISGAASPRRSPAPHLPFLSLTAREHFSLTYLMVRYSGGVEEGRLLTPKQRTHRAHSE